MTDRPFSSLWAVAAAAFVACSDELPVAKDTGFIIPDVEEEDVPVPVDVVDVVELPEPAKNSCETKWTYVMPESGIASQPVVTTGDETVIAAGDTLRRITLAGENAAACTPPFRAPGEVLGSPSMAATGTAFLGSGSGKLFSVGNKCTAKWTAPVNLRAKACEKSGNDFFCQPAEHPVREAPALFGNAIVLALDDTPALYRVDDIGNEGEFQWSFLSTDTVPLPGATAVIAGGDNDKAFAAFPTRRSVVAVNLNGSRRWEFSELLGKVGGPPERHVSSPLAVTKDGGVVFATGTPDGDAFTSLMIYRLEPTSPDKDARIAAGFPRPLGLALDAVRGIAIGPDESLILAMAGNGVIKLDSEGKQIWKFIGDEESLRATSVPTLGDDGSIFVTAEPNFVFGIDASGNRIFRYEAPGGGQLDTTSPAIREDGTVLVHLGSELKAYSCTETHGLAVSSWPRYQRNNRSSGRLEEPN